MKRTTSGLLLALAVPLHATADESVDTLDTVVVTATRTSIERDDALVPVIVIDRADIERSGALDLAELLRFHAGLEIARNGPPGSTTSLFTRGTESNQTLIMIDGVPINPGTIGGAALQNIAPDIIERVEVVKGPRSSLYGTEAMGGVVNVITRTGTSEPGLAVDIGGGRYGTREASVHAGTGTAKGGIGVTVARLDTDGFPARTASDVDNAHRNTSVNLDARLALGEATLSLRHWQAEGDTEYLDFFLTPAEQHFKNLASTLEIDWRGGQLWGTRLRASRMVDDIEQLGSTDFVKTDRDSIDWQNELAFAGEHRVVAGATFSSEDTTGLSFGSVLDEGDGDGRVRTDMLEIYAADDFTLGRHSMLVAGRYTDHDTFGSELTWNVEYGLALPGSTRFTAGAGTAFRAPDSTDRFGFGGKPDLAPERSQSYELGLRHQLGEGQRLGVQLFQTEIDDLIEFVVLDPLTFFGENRNIDRARIRGIELSYELDRAPWHLRVDAAAQQPEDRDTGMRLLRRARRSLTADLVRDVGRHEIGLMLLASGDRMDFGTPMPVALDSYLLANVTGALRISNSWTLRGRIENLLDERYETAAGFRSARRGLYLTLSYTTR